MFLKKTAARVREQEKDQFQTEIFKVIQDSYDRRNLDSEERRLLKIHSGVEGGTDREVAPIDIIPFVRADKQSANTKTEVKLEAILQILDSYGFLGELKPEEHNRLIQDLLKILLIE